MNTVEDIKRLQEEFIACQKMLIALSDEVRQHLLLIYAWRRMQRASCYRNCGKNKFVSSGSITSYADTKRG